MADESQKIANPPKYLLKNARQLRGRMTDAEQLIWRFLRARRFIGLKFRRQVPVAGYVLDFYCHGLALAIELDGGQHNADEKKTTDAIRTLKLNATGLTVLRYWNDDVLLNTDDVLASIYQCCIELKPELGALSPGPSPGGRGE